MRLRIRKSRQTGGRELVVTLQRGEALNPHQAAWLRDGHHKNYLSFSYEYQRDVTDATLHYDLDDTLSLETFRKKQPAAVDLPRMLVGVAEALTWCTSGRNTYFSILFDAKHVFVTPSSELRFVFLPIDGATFRVENSPLTLLRALSDTKRMRYPSPEDVVTAERLADHVLNADNAFSYNDFRTFLADNCRIDVDPDGTVHDVGVQSGDNDQSMFYSDSSDSLSSEAEASPMPWATSPRELANASYAQTAQSDVLGWGDDGGRARSDRASQPDSSNPLTAWQGASMPSATTLFNQPRRAGAQQVERTHVEPLPISETPTAAPAAPAPRFDVASYDAQAARTTLASAPYRPGLQSALQPTAPLFLHRMSTGDTYAIPPSGATIGRGTSNVIQVLGNTEIGRSHARIALADGGITITDVGSQNGTYVEGRRIAPNVAEYVAVGQRFSLSADVFLVERA